MSEWQKRARDVVQGISRGERQAVAPLVQGLSVEELQEAGAWVERELAEMPAVVGAWWDNPTGRQHNALQRLRAAVRGALGDAAAEERAALCDWMHGDASALPFVRLQLARGDRLGARLSASAALGKADCPDRAELERLLDEAVGVPANLARALDQFATAPSEEGWQALFRFTPPESDYDWLQYIIQGLMVRGVDGNRLFELASREVTSGLIGLIDSGLVDPAVVIERGWRSPGAQPLWISLAARAAFARGDEEETIRLLKQAREREKTMGFVYLQLLDIRERATSEFNERMDREGLVVEEG